MIKLKQIMHIENVTDYKIHVAKYDGYTNPLDDYIESFDKWLGWNSWRRETENRFTRKYVISFIDFYPQKGIFLFGGIFEILKTNKDNYEIKLLDDFKEFIGRLKVSNIKTVRGSAFYFEKHYEEIIVSELLDSPYSSYVFPGYENIDYPFKAIENITKNNTPDWKSALENIKGIYMLTDIITGKRYIGSAYGDYGIWSRWCQYCSNGHGGNKQLKDLVSREGEEYMKRSFKFTLLETHPMFKSDEFIILRESFWKEVMLSREENFGYNSN